MSKFEKQDDHRPKPDEIRASTPNPQIIKNDLSNTSTSVFVVKDKGGAGASTFASALATSLRSSVDPSDTIVIADGDGSTGTTITKMGERGVDGKILLGQSLERGVPFFNVFDQAGVDILFDPTKLPAQIGIYDLPATVLSYMKKLKDNLTGLDLVKQHMEFGRKVVIAIPITPDLTSIASVSYAIRMFGPNVSYVIVRNMYGATDKDFALWDADNFKNAYGQVVGGRSKALLASVNGTVIDMPALNSGVFAKIGAYELSYEEAKTSSHLGVTDRLCVKRWLAACALEFDKIRVVLGLPSGFEWIV